MTTVDEYHSYARDCLRWAAKARTEEQREQLLSLAKDWTQADEALDGLPVPRDLDCALARSAPSTDWDGSGYRVARGVTIHRARWR